jgi:nitrogen fixation-related uncharacterized protein
MYYPYFIVYMVIGFCVSLLALFWAVSRGQFRDQDRARYLPLEGGESPASLKVTRFNRYEAFALGALVLIGLAASAAVVVFSLLFGGRHG